MRQTLALTLFCLLALMPAGVSAAAPTAGLLTFAPSGQDAELDGRLTKELESIGYTVRPLDAAAVRESANLAGIDLLLLPRAATLPVRAMAPIREYLARGGDIIALGAPMWQRPMLELDRRWITREAYAHTTAAAKPEHVLFDYTPADVARCQRNTNHAEWKAAYESVPAGPAPETPALHVQLSNLEGWDSLSSPELQAPFPAGHTLTVLSARGSATTSSLAVEWMEKDGSRWIAVVPLANEWSRYVLGPRDFQYWQSNPAREHGKFEPANAVRLSIGLAFSHTGQTSGPQEYWVSALGTAPITPELAEVAAANEPTPLDALTPDYKFFDCTGVTQLRSRDDQNVVDRGTFPLPKQLRSPQPRPRGGGFNKGRTWRWVPLLEARSADGQWRGTPMTLLAHFDGTYKGGMWASCGVADPAWYRSAEAINAVRQVAEHMRRGVCILDGGSDKYTYFEDQRPLVGLRAADLNAFADSNRHALTGRVTVRDPGGATLYEKAWPLTLTPGEIIPVAEEWTAPYWSDAGLTVTAELLEAGRVIDRVSHEAHVWRPRRDKHFVTCDKGEFVLDGKRWRAHGMNYMPSSGIGTEDGGYFENWLGTRSYDPEVIDRDLWHLRDMGINAVSIFIYHEAARNGNLVDILRRIDAAGMKANLALRPSWPLNFHWDPLKDIIESCRLAENDTVFAYDLAWEPMWRGHDQRVPYDAAWAEWIVERYGSIEPAEKDWGFKVPRTPDGRVTNPLGHQVDTDGPWRRMTAAYRRFLDTLLYEKYGAARRLVRGIDPNHFVSFRMAEAANPTLKLDGWISYDWPYLAAAVDILSPEAYGRIGDWEKVKPGWFQATYAHWAAPDLPVMWAEAGVSVMELGRKGASPGRLAYQAQYYRDFYRMLIGSRADGIFFWWYPGGFRVGENSDFGIINPDGSDRPVTAVIRQHARKFLDGPSAGPVDRWLEFDRDAHTDGVTGVYSAVQKEFWATIADGRTPGLKTAAAGTDSSTCPLLAIGNTPCNGTNPPKYLDAGFESVEIMGADGKWVQIDKGGQCTVARDKPVVARVTLMNLGEAAWVVPRPGDNAANAGAVYLRVEGDATASVPLSAPIPHLKTLTLENVQLAPAGIGKPTALTLRLEARGRTPFGPRFRIQLNPAP